MKKKAEEKEERDSTRVHVTLLSGPMRQFGGNLIEATNPNAKDGLGNAHFVNSSNVVQLET